MGLSHGPWLSLLSLSACFSTLVHAVEPFRKPTVDFKAGNGSYLLSTKTSPVQVHADAADWPGVLRAANDLAVDFGRVTGVNGTLTTTGSATANASMIFNVTGINDDWSVGASSNQSQSASGAIIVGTIGNSSLIDSLIKSGKLDVSKIEGQWEAFVSTVVKNPTNETEQALVIAGRFPPSMKTT
jgi:hypothetical protein